MDAELKAKWVEALRSGKYHQAHGQLRKRDGSFCCLGVLLDIQNCDWSISGSATLKGAEFSATTSACGHAAGGLTFNQAEALIQRNDGGVGFRRHSFAQLADYIEANL